MDNDDDVLQEISDAFSNFPEEAIPLVIFNEEKKRKSTNIHHFILTNFVFINSVRTKRRRKTISLRDQRTNRYYCGRRNVSYW